MTRHNNNNSGSVSAQSQRTDDAAPTVASLLQPQPHTIVQQHADGQTGDNQSDAATAPSASPSMSTTSIPVIPLLADKNESTQTSTNVNFQPLSATTSTTLNGADPEYSNKSISDIVSTSKTNGDNSNGTYVDIDMIEIKQAAKQYGEPKPLNDDNDSNDDDESNKPKPSRQRTPYIHPEEKVGWIGYLLLTWINPIISRGFKQTIKLEDTLPMRSDMTAEYLTAKFQREWDAEVKKRGPENASIAYALARAFGWRYFFAGMCQCIANGVGFITPNLLNWLITYIAEASVLSASQQRADGYGYMLAVGLFLCAVVTILLTNLFYVGSLVTGIKVRAALIGAIYQKSLKLSPVARASMSTGQIVNMMAVDCTKIDLSMQFFHFSWTTIIQVIISIGLLLWVLGYPALAGIAIMIMFMPMQGYIMSFLGVFRRQAASKTDTRLKVMNEILQGIRVIKVYAWENSFLKRMIDARAAEMVWVKKATSVRGLNGVLNTGLPAVMNFLPFMTLSLTSSDGRLTAAQVFTGLVYLNMIRIPVIILPITFSMAADQKVAFARIGKFLLADELSPSAQPKLIDDVNYPNAIEIKDASFQWDVPPPKPEDEKKKQKGGSGSKSAKNSSRQLQPDKGTTVINIDSSKTSDTTQQQQAGEERRDSEYVFELKDIILTVPKGSLVAVIGSVGCGKSSLLQGLVGEMRRKGGDVVLSGTVGYCPQQAWIMNATLKDNILFGLPYDHDRYETAIRVCALESDLKVLPAGDQTEIGERGINLSGGQKQRVSLARSVYFNADILLWDDPLSAVDSHVSKYLFNECINGALKLKTRILVTHQLQYCSRVDWIVHLKDGKIFEQGTFEDLMAKRAEFYILMSEFGGAGDREDSDTEADLERITTLALQRNRTDNSAEQQGQGQRQEQEQEKDALDAKKANCDAGRVLISTEDKAEGKLEWGVWLFYMKACGGYFAFTYFIFWVCATLASRFLTDWWLTRWTAYSYNLTQAQWIGIYGGLTGAQFVAGAFYNIYLANRSVHAAIKLHNSSFAQILRAPMHFFDTVPIGRIMNRFSRDQDVIDNLLMMEGFRMLFYWIGTAIGTLIMISVFNFWFAIAIPFILLSFYVTQTYYRRTSRELKRMDAITRSPLFAHFSETLTGLSTIRAYRQQQSFIQGNYLRIDTNDRPYYLLQCSSRWLGERLEFMGGCVTFLTAAIGVATRYSVNPGAVGLSLSYALSLTQVLAFMVRNVVDTENNMNSVERCRSYTLKIEQEAPASLPDDSKIPPEWPDRGNIEFRDLSIRYRAGLPLVLKQLSFSISGGERIGVVGRTGAGKSSMMLALFRLVEAAEGSIIIDGLDISKLGLEKLRSSLAIMPQDPVLYSGTIRNNLDPFSQYTDQQLWDSLEKAYLKEAIEKQDLKLEAPVSEGGENWSIGQRCQICLARALLRNAKILIMDEATASIDMETDALIQESLRREFKNTTILTIAHRLNTIMDYNRVMVLSYGRIKEFAAPAELLRNEDSIFTSMVKETGAENAAMLKQIAFNAQQQRNEGKSEVTVWVPSPVHVPRDGAAVNVNDPLGIPTMPRKITAEDERKAFDGTLGREKSAPS